MGESTVEGFVTWREEPLTVFFGLFLGFGIFCAGSSVFSLSAFSKCSLYLVLVESFQGERAPLYLDLFTPLGLGEGATFVFPAFEVFFTDCICCSCASSGSGSDDTTRGTASLTAS